jgi:hypothetical protein
MKKPFGKQCKVEIIWGQIYRIKITTQIRVAQSVDNKMQTVTVCSTMTIITPPTQIPNQIIHYQKAFSTRHRTQLQKCLSTN